MTNPEPGALPEADPFDLPDWLGTAEVTWEPETGIRTGHLVRGRLRGEQAGDELPCDLLAVDEAYPVPVADDHTRLRTHQAWRHGQIFLVCAGDRLTLAVPGTVFTADGVLDALSRLAKAVGASTDQYAARLRIGGDQTRRSR